MRAAGRALAALGVLAWAAEAGRALACAVCFGNPNDPMARAAMTGVWFLLAVVVGVQIAFAVFFFVYLRRRLRIYPDGSLKPVFRVVK